MLPRVIDAVTVHAVHHSVSDLMDDGAECRHFRKMRPQRGFGLRTKRSKILQIKFRARAGDLARMGHVVGRNEWWPVDEAAGIERERERNGVRGEQRSE